MERVKGGICPTCKLKLDGVTCVDDFTISPEPGDITFCLDCAEFLMFNEDMSVRKVEKSDMLKFSLEDLNHFQEVREKLIVHIMANAMNKMTEV